MRRVMVVMGFVIGWWGVAAMAEAAQDKPLSELPRDLARWSTVWMDIPRAMYDVGMEEGPVTAMMWGPVKGTAKLIHTTTQTLWEVAQPQQPRHPSQARRPGVILQYEF